MVAFSANLGFLWTDLSLPDAVRAAARAGFDAVECHFPYDVDPAALRAALDDTGLPLLGLNTRPGDTMGLAAVPGRGSEARAAVDEAIAYARAVGAQAIHVMAGVAEGTAATDAFEQTLAYAVDRAGDITILIEPLNARDVPGYFLKTQAQARDVLQRVPGARLMFDCYHVALTEGDVLVELDRCWPAIGHIQFAGVPDRGVPDRGAVDYRAIFAAVDAAGWQRPLGAEYRPVGATEDSLGWMSELLAAR